MQDKEVGELWHSRGVLERTARQMAEELIHKLVEERANCPCMVCLREALDDFDIDPKEWK